MSDDDQQVWTASTANKSGCRPLHTEEDCPALRQATTVLGPKPRSVFGDDREICKRCSGEHDCSDNYNTDIRATLADPDFGPEDLGLPPLGERGESA